MKLKQTRTQGLRLKPLASNMTELTLQDGTRVLFSYETPVAYSKITELGRETYKTNQYYSRTTSKHINKWEQTIHGEVNQSVLDELVK